MLTKENFNELSWAFIEDEDNRQWGLGIRKDNYLVKTYAIVTRQQNGQWTVSVEYNEIISGRIQPSRFEAMREAERILLSEISLQSNNRQTISH